MDLRNKVPFFMNYANGYMDTVSGVSPLLLPKAKANSLQYVKAFGGTEQGLPDGYTQLEYIVFDSTQVIDTGFTPNNNSRIESKGYRTVSDCWFYGASPANPRVSLYHASLGTSRWGYQSGSSFGFSSGTEYTLIQDKNGITINGTLRPWTSGTDDDFTCDRTLTIGNCNGATGTRYFAGNLYYMKIYDNNVLARDFVPCKNASNVVGLYDRVNDVFYTDTGLVAGPEAVPTPDAPMDIVSNNGVLKARHQSGLPLGYTLLESATGYQNQSIIDSGVAGNNDKLRIVIRARKDTTQNYTPLFGNYVDESSNVTRVIAGSSAGSVIFNLNRQSANSDSASDVRFTSLHTYDLYKDENGRSVLEIDGEVAGTSVNTQGTENATNISIGNSRVLTQEPSTLAQTFWSFRFCKIYDDGVLIRDYVPVKRNSDNVVGIYDLVNHTFDAGQYPSFAPFSAGNVASDPVEIYTDGTVETINVHGKNLFDKADNAQYIGAYVNSNTGVLTSYNLGYCFCVPCKPNTTYTLNGMTGNSTWGSFTSNSIGTVATEKTVGNGSLTTGANDKYLIGIAYTTTTNPVDYRDALQIERGSTATAYATYYNGGTATAEMLLKVGDYQDVQSIIDGGVTRNVGIKVLDGTENWVASGNLFYADIATDALEDTHSCYCTHFKGVATNASASYNNEIKVGTNATQIVRWARVQIYPVVGTYSDVTAFKQWLADQYAAGHPVIIIYPLATPTTETVTGQTLQVQSGANTLEITQASLNGLTLEAKYRRNK